MEMKNEKLINLKTKFKEEMIFWGAMLFCDFAFVGLISTVTEVLHKFGIATGFTF